MNVLQILPELNVGGVKTGTLDLAKELVQRGHKAVVISAGGELVKKLCSFKTKHYSLPVHRKSLFSVISQIKEVRNIIRKEKIDIVHARSRVPALIAFFAARRENVPFITTCHGYYKKHLFSRVMGWGKRVIVGSQIVGKHMVDDFGVPPERLRLVPRGVDLDNFEFQIPSPKSKKDEFTIGIIGRITPIKGHLSLVKAIPRVIRVFPKLKVLIVGDASRGKEKHKEEIELLVR